MFVLIVVDQLIQPEQTLGAKPNVSVKMMEHTMMNVCQIQQIDIVTAYVQKETKFIVPHLLDITNTEPWWCSLKKPLLKRIPISEKVWEDIDYNDY